MSGNLTMPPVSTLRLFVMRSGVRPHVRGEFTCRFVGAISVRSPGRQEVLHAQGLAFSEIVLGFGLSHRLVVEYFFHRNWPEVREASLDHEEGTSVTGACLTHQRCPFMPGPASMNCQRFQMRRLGFSEHPEPLRGRRLGARRSSEKRRNAACTTRPFLEMLKRIKARIAWVASGIPVITKLH